MLNLRINNRQTPTQPQPPDAVIQEIAAKLAQRYNDGEISIEQLAKIRDLANNKVRLMMVLPML